MGLSRTLYDAQFRTLFEDLENIIFGLGTKHHILVHWPTLKNFGIFQLKMIA